MLILTLNAGSNSLKFEIVDSERGTNAATAFGRSLLAGSFDDIGKDSCRFALLRDKHEHARQSLELADHGKAAIWLLDWLDKGSGARFGFLNSSAVVRVGHRVVHGGDSLTQPIEITDEVLHQIEALKEMAPLHTDSVLRVIDATRTRLAAPAIAVIDNAFHRTLPDTAACYAIPREIATRHRIKRYGFHGISHQYLMLRFAEITRRQPSELNLVTCHLEGGSSAAAIRRGQSVDTSMGFTPLEGLVMGSRCGDLDPSIAFHLMRKEGWSVDEVERFLNEECGLKGVSKFSADSRELRRHLDEPSVKLAWDMFCYRVSKYIGAYLTVLGGADAIIFAGGIGENTPEARSDICARLRWCGALLDEARNTDCVERESMVSSVHATIPIWVIPTQENLMMARHVADWQPTRNALHHTT